MTTELEKFAAEYGDAAADFVEEMVMQARPNYEYLYERRFRAKRGGST